MRILIDNIMKKPYSDETIRIYIDKVLQYSIRYIPQKVTPNHITFFGFILGLLGCGAIIYEEYCFAGVLLLLNRILDAMDGIYARSKGIASDVGAFLDIVFDFIIYSFVPLAFAIQKPDEYAVTSAMLIFSFMVCGSSFLAFGIFAQKHALQSSVYYKKNIYYMRGLVEGSETCIFISLVLFFPQYFIWISNIFGVLCIFTGIGRIVYGYRILKQCERQEKEV